MLKICEENAGLLPEKPSVGDRIIYHHGRLEEEVWTIVKVDEEVHERSQGGAIATYDVDDYFPCFWSEEVDASYQKDEFSEHKQRMLNA